MTIETSPAAEKDKQRMLLGESIKSSTEDSSPTSVLSEPPIPGLVRAILVDSKVSPGRNIEIPLDGNTLITGRNAAGKTSLIQLMPLFWGESPNKVSDKNQNKHFIPYYLPNNTSYIAFEYIYRGGQSRSVIIYASRDGTKLRYRFVRSALYADMFETDHEDYITSDDLSRHLKMRGYTCASEAITTLWEYKMVLQGTGLPQVANNRRRFLNELISDYSISYSSNPLTNMERVVSSMLKKKSSLPEIQKMIAESILANNSKMSFGTGEKRLDKWPDQFRSYQNIMRKEADVRRLQGDEQRLEELKQEMIECFVEAREIRRSAELSLKELSGSLSRTEVECKEKVSTLSNAKDKIRDAFRDAGKDYDDLEREIDDIKRRAAKYENNKVREKQNDFESLPQLQQTYSTLTGQIKGLRGEFDDLTANFNELKEAERSASRERILKIEKKLDEAEGRQNKSLAKQEAAHKKAMMDMAISYEKKIEVSRERVTQASSAVAVAKDNAASPRIPQKVIDCRDAASRALSEIQTKISAAQAEQAEKMRLLTNAQRGYEDAEKKQQENNRLIDQTEKKLDDLECLMQPEPGSLLEYLRAEIPEWESTVAKVINPALLMRTDLDPAKGDKSGGVFGLMVDLEVLEPAATVDIEKQRAEKRTLEKCLEELQDESDRLQHAANTAYRVRSEAETQYDRATNLVNNIRKKLDKAHSDFLHADKAVANEKETAAEKSAAVLSNAQAILSKRSVELNALLERQRADIKKASERQDAERQKLLRKHKEEKDAYRSRMKADRIHLNKTIEALDEDLRLALRKKGVDDEKLKVLEDKVGALRARIAEIQNYDTILAEWRLFKKNDLSRLSEMETNLIEAATAKEDLAKDLDSAMETLRKEENAFNEKIADIKNQIELLRLDIGRADQILERNEYSLPDTVPEVSRTISKVAMELNEIASDRKKLSINFDRDVRAVRTIFMEDAGATPAEFISSRTSNSLGDVQVTMRALVDWFNEEHQNYKQLLIMQGRTITNSIKSAFNTLKDTHERIERENLRLQRSLNRNNPFDVVEEIGIRIESQIKSVDGWNAMEDLSALHDEWVRNGGDQPPKGYLEAMTKMVSFLPTGPDKSIDLRQYIRLQGYIVENGVRRNFHAKTDLSDISSNGVSYLVLLTIFVGFINMVRGSKNPVRIVWALDELSDIDAVNTRKLLKMLDDNFIKMIAATPQAEASVRKLFDFRLQMTPEKKIQNVPGATARRLGMRWSPQEGLAPSQRATEMED
jgi:hypothetical protein